MTHQLPSTQKALQVNASADGLELNTNVPVPSPDSLKPGHILMKIHAAGVNHIENYFIDGKIARPGDTYGTTMGGEVIAIGPDVTRFKVGDPIGSFVFHADERYPDVGGFQEYCVVPECNSVNVPLHRAEQDDLIPAGPITTYESVASAMGNIITVGASIHYAFGHTDEKDKTILIYGGTTGVGQLSIQYCRTLGWKIITIASEKHWDYLKSIGADTCLDYHTDNLARDITALGEDIDFWYVTAGQREGMKAVYEAIPTDRPVKLESLEIKDMSYLGELKSNIEFGFTRAFTCHNETIQYAVTGSKYEAREGLFEKILEFMPIAEDYIKKGIFTQPPVKILPGGLNAVRDGMKMLKNKEVSNLRLVVRVE